VIPVYNEEGIVASSVVALRESLKELGWSFQILLADVPERFLQSENWFVRAFLDGEVPKEEAS